VKLAVREIRITHKSAMLHARRGDHSSSLTEMIKDNETVPFKFPLLAVVSPLKYR